jgi:opacity protein-like surface antigen
MDRLSWLLLALVLMLAGIYLDMRFGGEWLAYLLAGIGAGIGLALLGSVIHDAVAGQRNPH